MADFSFADFSFGDCSAFRNVCTSFDNVCSFRSFNSSNFTSNFTFRSNNTSNFTFRSDNTSNFTFRSNNTSNFTFRSNNTSNFAFKNFSTLATPSNGVYIRWTNDVRVIYENLNKTREQYNIATVTVPEYGSGTKAVISHYNDLKSLIEAMSSNAHIGTNASTSGLTIPTAGTLIRYSSFTDLNTVIVRMHDQCINFVGTNN